MWLLVPYYNDRSGILKNPIESRSRNSVVESSPSSATAQSRVQPLPPEMPYCLVQVFDAFKRLLSTNDKGGELDLFEVFKSSIEVELLLSNRELITIGDDNYKKVKNYSRYRIDQIDQCFTKFPRRITHEALRLSQLPNIIRNLYGQLKLHKFDVLRSDKDQWVRIWSIRRNTLSVEKWLREQANYGWNNNDDDAIFLHPYGVSLLDLMMQPDLNSMVSTLSVLPKSQSSSNTNDVPKSLLPIVSSVTSSGIIPSDTKLSIQHRHRHRKQIRPPIERAKGIKKMTVFQQPWNLKEVEPISISVAPFKQVDDPADSKPSAMGDTTGTAAINKPSTCLV